MNTVETKEKPCYNIRKGGGAMRLDYIKITNENGGVMHGGNQCLFGRNIHRSGCGMIAACDMLLYKQNKKALTMDDYKQFITENSQSFFYKFHFNLIGISARRIIKFLRKQGYTFRFIPRYSLKGETLEQTIKKSLENDTPVIVRIGLNGKKLPYCITYTVNGRISQGTMSWHYITVTGLENDILTFSSWGGTGEMSLSDLQQHFGFMGGIII